MKVIILCGGFGTRLREETSTIPKPMVEIGGRPIVWHIMKTFSQYGHNEFILCLGYKSDVIKNYFLHYSTLTNDFSIELGSGNIDIHNQNNEHDWKITLVDTGLNTMTGARVKKIESYITDEVFMLTYGDGVTDLNINNLIDFHKSHNKIGTVTGVSPPSRYGELSISNGTVTSFEEKPDSQDSFINGGYFVFNKEFFTYLTDDDQCVLERDPLENLTLAGQLQVFTHTGFWQCMDTYRDYVFLNENWDNDTAKWKIW